MPSYLKFIKYYATGNYKLALADEKLVLKRKDLWDVISGWFTNRVENNDVCHYLDQNHAALHEAFCKLYYSPDKKEQALALKFHKIFKRALPNSFKERLNLITPESSQWMQKLPESVKNKRLDEILLPGTHDSGAYALSGMLPRTNSFLDKLALFILSIPLINRFITNNTLTQKKSIEEQLRKGVRQFDFRVAMGDDGKCYLAHTFLCRPLENELEKLNDFLEKNRVKISSVMFDNVTDSSVQTLVNQNRIGI